MIQLIIDTSHRFLATGIVKDNTLVSYKQEEMKQKQSEYLISFIQDVIEEANISKKDINEIVVTDGPGSYTGMRIALTFVKVFALTQDIKVYTINTLYSVIGKYDGFVMLDARSKRVFGAKVIEGNLIDDRIYQLDELENLDLEKFGDTSLIDVEEKPYNIIQNIVDRKDKWRLVDNVDTLSPRY